jgi:uncharacterized BrkB/YihY/UPF0761 family membrane protein
VTYGSFAAPIILLFWLWLTNVAMLFGAEINAANAGYQQVVEARAAVAPAPAPAPKNADEDARDLPSTA